MTNDNMTNEIQSELRKISDGVRSDIFKSYEALNLLHMIGANATDINSSDFVILFGRLQLMLQEQIILLVAKIFEKPDVYYSLNSIPVIVKLIKDIELQFSELESKKETFIMLMKQIGCKSFKNDDNVTEVFLKYWQNYIGERKSIRERIETLRNKVAAHHENIEYLTVLPDISLTEVIDLLERSKIFLAIIDSAYLNLDLFDYEDNYFANSESKTASLILKNLLVKAHVIDIQKGREISKNLHE